MERLPEGIYFLCPQFFVLILIVVHVTLYLCRKVQNNFDPIVYYSGGREKKTLLSLSHQTMMMISTQN